MSEIANSMIYLTQKKSTTIAYILLIFLGALGIHRFYLKTEKMATYILCSQIFGITLMIVGPMNSDENLGEIGILLLIINAIILFCDLFKLPGMVFRFNKSLLKGLNFIE